MMKKIFCLSLSVMLFLIFATWGDTADPNDGVLKVFVTSNSMDFYRPWQSEGSRSGTGSACVISGNRILTNAHVVRDHTFIQVRKASDPKKYTAKVLAIGDDCDLALLTVEDHAFFEGIVPFEFGDLPRLQEAVTVIGYPEGGDKLSITEGVVSRVEIIPYLESLKQLLGVQIDAAINPGNSGGPVLKNGKLVGIAMQGMLQSQNIGYMIPSPIMEHFFKDLEDGEYNGFPLVGIDINSTENTALRKFYKIDDRDGGVVISTVMPDSAGFGILKEGDIIFEINGVPIGVDGTFKFRDDERLSLTHLISQRQTNEGILIKYIRNGELKQESIRLTNYVPLVQPPNYFSKPPYYIYGGMVFTVLSTDLLKSWGQRWWEQAPLDFIYYLAGVGRLNKAMKKEIVVLLQVLPDDINAGYHSIKDEVITKVNGQEITSFKEFVKLLHAHQEPYAIIETESNSKMILKNEGINAVNHKILERNNISSQYSEDVGKWLEETTATKN